MRTIGNILWYFPFLGFLTAILTMLFGLILTATIVASPIGIGLMEYGKFLLKPFGNTMISKDKLNIKQNTLWEAYSAIVSIIYFPLGLCLACFAITQVFALCFSIVGIPIALVIAKSLRVFLNPVNKKCVPISVAAELENRKGQIQVDTYLNKTY
ncbi:hypothetical protein JJC03_09245 [Flavobacterium oreochromis]|uniref:YccF domain-containing protein n=1 Tax=Flavobacterium oreochromis TaxID=2906078 RepID=UPI001CE4D6E0|nr:YccF domain-containing protein [Flavobacterium oreochromis]QYS85423.1 hypothetical protein JJC03_09245 [Flavobacterium oreochromis]